MPRPKSTGPRTRFNGFTLTDAERDRVVADWIDTQPNAAEAIKALIYTVATNGSAGGHREAAAIHTSEEQQSTLNPADPRVAALAGALDT